MRFETSGIGEETASLDSGGVLILDQLQQYIRYAKTPARAGMSNEELEWMGAVTHRYAYPPSLFRYSLALALNNLPAEAQRELKVLRQLHGEEMYQEALGNFRLLEKRYPVLQTQREFRERYIYLTGSQ